MEALTSECRPQLGNSFVDPASEALMSGRTAITDPPSGGGNQHAQSPARENVPFIHRIYRLVGARFRRRRMADFLASFAVTPSTRILDVGGTRIFWSGIPAQVTTVNLDPSNADQVADARRLPFADRSFDIVFSNSLIEHVGTYEDQIACAREIARVGFRYYVQTPNQRFPIEPHFLAPFIHWFPLSWRRRLIRLTPWAILTRPDRETIEQFLSTTRMLTAQEMKALFPDAEIGCERFCGLTKSLIARRT
jgi:hypothetical protein